ncbi:MAG: hypothetical protein JWP45_692 [Mucilaginibacter sp.]|nr:hypothetical protein [Mucilaginibacter sp.]
MKYVITGSTGHISKPLSEQLIKAGHDVTIISSNDDKVKQIEDLGATASIGSVEDVAFLTKTFAGTDAVYTMVPPKWDAKDWKEYIHSIGKNYAAAIKASGVKKVVNLSSVGAHMPKGCGPVSGLYFVEQELNTLEGVDVRHLRPAYFYYNLLGNIGMIKHMGIIGGNYGDVTIPIVHPHDIAAVAAEELLKLDFKGKSIRYIAGDECNTSEIAKVLGSAIGKPDLQWVKFKDEDALSGILQAGLPQDVAENYVEMGTAIASGEMTIDYYKHRPALSPVKLEDFAKEFAAAYANS